jgi:hypothetical protein
MRPPMIGSWQVRVEAVRPFSIHGDEYYELQVTRTETPEEAAGFVLRVPEHATAGEPVAGQRLEITFLMGQVTAARVMQ